MDQFARSRNALDEIRDTIAGMTTIDLRLKLATIVNRSKTKQTISKDQYQSDMILKTYITMELATRGIDTCIQL